MNELPSASGSPPSLSADLDRLGKYVELSLIGQGAMGRVYRGRDPVLDRRVAIKTILPGSGVFHEEAMVRRFQREARIAASLNHPGIVTIHELGEEGGFFYLVMEHLEGEDLGAALRRRALGGLYDKVSTFEAIVDAVAYAHERGMVHRDLKPSNVFRLADGRTKILDFGLARWAEAPKTTFGITGTPHYMSPEQVRGESVDERSDIFSLGAMFYEMLTDQRCFPAANIHAILFQVLQRQPVAMREIRPELPELADRVVAKALAKEPELRFAQARDFLAAVRALRRFLAGELDEAGAAAVIGAGPVSLPAAPVPAWPQLAGLGLPAAAPGSAGTGANPESVTLVGQPGGTVPSAAVVSPAAVAAPAPAVSEVPTAGTAAGRVSAAAPVPAPLRESEVAFLREEKGDLVVRARHGERQTLLDLALAAGVPLYHECGGRARCSTCRVRVVKGTGLLPATDRESRLATRAGWGPDIRLSCQAVVVGDVQVQRLIHDVDDFGLLRGERHGHAARETTLAVLAVRMRNQQAVLDRSAPYDIVHLLNRFYFEVGEPILAAGGLISEYRETGLIAYFGLDQAKAREKCLAAVRAGLRIVLRLHSLATYLRTHFGFDPQIGLGIHFGRAVVGSLGHPSQQFVSALGEINPIAFWLAGVEPLHPPCLLGTEEVVNLLEDELRFGEVLADSGARSLDRNAWEIRDLRQADGVLMVQSSFDAILPRRREAAELFYRLLFQIDPEAQALFENVDLKRQGDKLMDVLATAVQSLGRFDELRPVLRELGRRHLRYGVKLRQFDSVEQALIEMLHQMLGPAFTPELKTQWLQTLGSIAAEMIGAGGFSSGTKAS
jgi:ferredoxin/hemoglobin-like flavoprotein/tRNA A-37 threonylcarbamoyl transferase component Bud32